MQTKDRAIPNVHEAVVVHNQASELELSIVMPCLNEADTLATCIEKAQRALRDAQISGEVVIADNGSTDGSQAIAERMGARVVPVAAKGYGNALMGGIAAARGQYIIMGDADDSYDFLEAPKFVQKLREGFSLVQGCRLPAGGGTVLPGAMPFLHRWLGNPMFSLMTRHWFHAPIHDVYCGLRGFTKELYNRLDQRCVGMEFATEMIIKSSLYKEKIAEVPITLHPDGRKAHAPHLRTFRDGWRTLRFFLMYCPRWLFLFPGATLILLGLLGYAVAMPGLTFGGLTFDAHTLLFASLAILCGYQSILFALFTKTFAISEGLMPEDPRMNRFFSVINLERGLILAVGTLLLRAGAARRGNTAMESERMGSAGLRSYNALGRSGFHADGAGIPDDSVQFLREYSGDAPQMSETTNPTANPAETDAEFDMYAARYDEALAQGISVSGEDKNYFAEGRVVWLRGLLEKLGEKPRTVLDFGCGTGAAAPFLLEHLGVESALGVDISSRLIERAAQTYSSDNVRFATLDDSPPQANFDLAFCNGVFHHIPLDQRDGAVKYVLDSLRPGGLFAFWENNPWNPGTRYVMSRIPFDKDAITLPPPEARRLLRSNGFEIVSTKFLFIFPKSLGFLRGLEPPLARLPLGTQYQVLCRKA